MPSQVSSSRVSARYAEGLYKAAKVNNCIDAIESNIDELLSVLETTPKLSWFLENPTISRDTIQWFDNRRRNTSSYLEKRKIWALQ